MIELVFEIGCEELPARFVEPALDQLEDAFRDECEENRLDARSVRTVGTPRRLTLLCGELSEKQADLEEVKTGPPLDAAYANGEPTVAAEGFADAHGVDVSELFTVEKDHGNYVAAKVQEIGEEAGELLPDMLKRIIDGLSFPKSMRWAGYDERFGRPVRWLLAVAGGEVVSLKFAGVRSGARTRGHRFAAPEPVEVRSIDDYFDGLDEAHVEVDPRKRRKSIEDALHEMGIDVGGRVVDDPELIDEVVHLVEKPHATRLDYGEQYLELPDEVLVESMRSHQRYFAIETEDGEHLLPHCGVIYNTPVYDPDVVNEGNLRVLRARLDDAMFFWEKDLEQSLEDRLDELNDVVWIERVGTMRDRAERISGTAETIADMLDLPAETGMHAERAGLLSKSDLVTEMVDEFSDLQGVMGREYALQDGEADEVATAIYEQYLPRGADDDLPETDAGACVALAEKLDALVGCFGAEMEPTSTSDPYGLRRAALGVIRIVEDRSYTIPLSELFAAALDQYDEAGVSLAVSGDELRERLLEFVTTRLRYQLAESYPTDVVDAVLAAVREDVVGIHGRVDALAELTRQEDFEDLALGFKRVVNILEKEEATTSVDVDLLEDDSEVALYEAFRATRDRVEEDVAERRWEAACNALIKLKEPVDEFFESVMVMADDEQVRRNRIALLHDLRELFLQVGDISKVAGRR